MEGKTRIGWKVRWLNGRIVKIYIFIWPYRIAFVPRQGGRLVRDKKDFARYDKDRGYGPENFYIPPDKFKPALKEAYRVYEEEQRKHSRKLKLMAGARAAEFRHRRVLGDDY